MYKNTKPEGMETKTENKPFNQIRVKNIVLSIWKNTIQLNDKETSETEKFSLQKIYKDKKEKWCYTQTFDYHDLNTIREVIEVYKNVRNMNALEEKQLKLC